MADNSSAKHRSDKPVPPAIVSTARSVARERRCSSTRDSSPRMSSQSRRTAAMRSLRSRSPRPIRCAALSVELRSACAKSSRSDANKASASRSVRLTFSA
jgi:hypothetical protein